MPLFFHFHYGTSYPCRESAECLAHTFISSRLDYMHGNALLCGAPKVQLPRLRRLQNLAARVVMRSPKWAPPCPPPFNSCCHKTRRWLPVGLRIQYKLLLLTFKRLHRPVPPHVHHTLQSCSNLTGRIDRYTLSQEESLVNLPRPDTLLLVPEHYPGLGRNYIYGTHYRFHHDPVHHFDHSRDTSNPSYVSVY